MRPPSSPLMRYLVALAITLATVLLRALVDPVLKNTQPGLFFFPVIYPVGRWLGIGPAVLSVVVGLTACRYLFYTPRGQFFSLELRQQISILYYWMFAMLIILAVHLRKKQVDSLELEIANRKQAESDLRLGREEFRALAEKCPTGIFRTDATGACTYVNEYWSRISGRPAAESLGAGWGNAIHPEDLPHVLDVWHAALAAHRGYTVEYRVQLPDGTLRHAITTAQPVTDEHGNFDHYIGTVSDITDLKRAYVSLEQKEQVLRNLIEAQEYEKQAIGNDIHDGLLQYAIGARMLLESLVRDHPEAPGVDVIEAVQDYLAKGIEEGRQVVRGVRPTVLDDLGLAAALEDLVAQLEKGGVGVQCRISVDLTAISTSLQTTIYRIVQESLSNVRKHSGSDRAMLSVRQVDGGLRLEIEDRGHGFEIESARRKGFGLVGMLERARLAGGALQIDSAPGRGTRITVELPLTPTQDYKSADEHPALI